MAGRYSSTIPRRAYDFGITTDENGNNPIIVGRAYELRYHKKSRKVYTYTCYYEHPEDFDVTASSCTINLKVVPSFTSVKNKFYLDREFKKIIGNPPGYGYNNIVLNDPALLLIQMVSGTRQGQWDENHQHPWEEFVFDNYDTGDQDVHSIYKSWFVSHYDYPYHYDDLVYGIFDDLRQDVIDGGKEVASLCGKLAMCNDMDERSKYIDRLAILDKKAYKKVTTSDKARQLRMYSRAVAGLVSYMFNYEKGDRARSTKVTITTEGDVPLWKAVMLYTLMR